MSSDARWYEERSELLAFARALVSTGDVDASLLLEFIEKPWKWGDEHHAWEKLGRPETVEEYDDLDRDTWDGRRNELARRYASVP